MPNTSQLCTTLIDAKPMLCARPQSHREADTIVIGTCEEENTLDESDQVH